MMILRKMRRCQIEDLIRHNGEEPTETLVRVYIISIRDDLNWVRSVVKSYMNATAYG
ncbi:MAG: hypothetical protein OXG04_10320 [Acidobacteria bacterium]|nr:hypothetical protein [Acidobacteriota bacterium]